MSWKETPHEKFDTPAITIMVCDNCGKEHEWDNLHRDYDNPDEETIEIAKNTTGWCHGGIHQYNGTHDDLCQVEVMAIDFHLCPDCVKELGIPVTAAPSSPKKVRPLKEPEEGSENPMRFTP